MSQLKDIFNAETTSGATSTTTVPTPPPFAQLPVQVSAASGSGNTWSIVLLTVFATVCLMGIGYVCYVKFINPQINPPPVPSNFGYPPPGYAPQMYGRSQQYAPPPRYPRTVPPSGQPRPAAPPMSAPPSRAPPRDEMVGIPPSGVQSSETLSDDPNFAPL